MAGLMLYIGLLSEANQPHSPFHKVSKNVERIGAEFSTGFRMILNVSVFVVLIKLSSKYPHSLEC